MDKYIDTDEIGNKEKVNKKPFVWITVFILILIGTVGIVGDRIEVELYDKFQYNIDINNNGYSGKNFAYRAVDSGAYGNHDWVIYRLADGQELLVRMNSTYQDEATSYIYKGKKDKFDERLRRDNERGIYRLNDNCEILKYIE